MLGLRRTRRSRLQRKTPDVAEIYAGVTAPGKKLGRQAALHRQAQQVVERAEGTDQQAYAEVSSVSGWWTAAGVSHRSSKLVNSADEAWSWCG